MNLTKNCIEISSFGKIDSGIIHQYTLKNENGMQVKILNYGGIITNLLVPDKNNVMGDVVLGFDSLENYILHGQFYFGCLIGRYAGRIPGARISFDGNTYVLPDNNDGNTLHGGWKGFDKVIWKATPSETDCSIRINYVSKNGEEGFPGNLSVEVVYTLTPDNSLKIDYRAFTDTATPVNLTHHSYFDLSAGKEKNILQHELMLNANEYATEPGKLPQSVKETAMDFTKVKKIGTDIGLTNGGYDNCWILKETNHTVRLAATVHHQESGRYMEVFTTSPAIVFYTGNFLDGSVIGKNEKNYNKRSGFCLETQCYANDPESFEKTLLRPGSVYRQTTIYHFSTR